MNRFIPLAWVFALVLSVPACGDGSAGTTGAGGDAGSGAGASGGSGGQGGTGGAAGHGGPVTERRVFVTSGTYDGALGGIAGADAACQTLAVAAALGGTWKAWVGDGTQAPSTTFVHSTVPYVRVDGVTIAADWTELTDAMLDAPIDHDETGTAIDPNGNTHVWTGASTTGDPLPYHCSGWTSATDSFTPRGLATATDSTWVMAGPDPCATKNHLYCFEQ